MKSKPFFKGTDWVFSLGEIEEAFSKLAIKISVEAINVFVSDMFNNEKPENRAALSFKGWGKKEMAADGNIFLELSNGFDGFESFKISLDNAFDELNEFGVGNDKERKKFSALAGNLEKWAGKLREKVTEYDKDGKDDKKDEASGMVEG